MTRRVLLRAAEWLSVFTVLFVVQWVFGRPGGRAALWAATYATAAPLVRLAYTRLPGVRRVRSEHERPAGWRTYREGTTGRWHVGRLRQARNVVFAIPHRGSGETRIEVPDVRAVSERAPGRHESWVVRGPARVLVVRLDDRDVHLVVRERDVAEVRRWLGQDPA